MHPRVGVANLSDFTMICANKQNWSRFSCCSFFDPFRRWVRALTVQTRYLRRIFFGHFFVKTVSFTFNNFLLSLSALTPRAFCPSRKILIWTGAWLVFHVFRAGRLSPSPIRRHGVSIQWLWSFGGFAERGLSTMVTFSKWTHVRDLWTKARGWLWWSLIRWSVNWVCFSIGHIQSFFSTFLVLCTLAVLFYRCHGDISSTKLIFRLITCKIKPMRWAMEKGEITAREAHRKVHQGETDQGEKTMTILKEMKRILPRHRRELHRGQGVRDV